jgi:hypothetical protein
MQTYWLYAVRLSDMGTHSGSSGSGEESNGLDGCVT